ncbi:MAG: hypothetical protein KGH52_02855 [Candidatus Micrarchaeota archaeon]|nr:hypothetical protein [Candidatus Micrarchaeota archaeon]
MVVASKLLAVMEPRANDSVLRVVGRSEESITYSINPMYASQTKVFSGFATFQMSSGYAYSADEKLTNSIFRVGAMHDKGEEKGLGEILAVPMDEMRKLGRVTLVIDTNGSAISSEDAIAYPKSALPNRKGRVNDLLITSERFARVNGMKPGEIVSLIQDPTKSKIEFRSILHESLRDRSTYQI